MDTSVVEMPVVEVPVAEKKRDSEFEVSFPLYTLNSIETIVDELPYPTKDTKFNGFTYKKFRYYFARLELDGRLEEEYDRIVPDITVLQESERGYTRPYLMNPGENPYLPDQDLERIEEMTGERLQAFMYEDILFLKQILGLFKIPNSSYKEYLCRFLFDKEQEPLSRATKLAIYQILRNYYIATYSKNL